MKRILPVLIFVFFLVSYSYAQDKQTIEKSEIAVVINGISYYQHTVGKGQTLYSISKAYNVDINLINESNPELKEGLKAGMILKIPIPVEIPVKTEEPVVVKKESPIVVTQQTAVASCEAKPHTETFNICLFIPLYLNEIDSINTANAELAKQSLNAKSLRFLQFYEGFLMAVDTLKSQGLSIKLQVYDVNEDTLKMRKILNKAEISKTDLIIGLTYGNIFSQLASFGRKHKIPVINPLSNKPQHIEGNPYVFLTNPTGKDILSSICTYISDKYSYGRVILICSKKENENKTLRLISETFELLEKERGKGPEIIDASIGSNAGTLPGLLSAEKQNLIILFSNDELFVADYARRLMALVDRNDIILCGMPGWQEFQSLESATLVRLKYHSFSNSFIDYEDRNVTEFIKAFRKSYKTEPGDFAFQGYDIGSYFLEALLLYGREFSACTSQFHKKCLQTSFYFNRKDGEGFSNSWLNIFKYEDYRVIDARR